MMGTQMEPHRVSGCDPAKRCAKWSLHHVHADSITVEQGIVGQKRKRLDKALRNQQTVERISMNGWKAGDAGCVDCGYRQFDQAISGNVASNWARSMRKSLGRSELLIAISEMLAAL